MIMDQSVHQESSNNVRVDTKGRTAFAHNRIRWIAPIHALAGAVLGVLVLHPVTMVIYFLEFHPELSRSDVFGLVGSRITDAFVPHMWPMIGAFALIGGALGIGSGLYSRAIAKKMLVVSQLDRKLGTTVELLLRGGESEAVEFKSSLRWDHQQKRCNKALESVVVKTIAGFLNHTGGDLLIGVADDGSVVGLEPDYTTLRKKDRDGFELLLLQLVKRGLGGDICTLLHAVFQDIEGCDVCRLLIEPSNRPVYVLHDDKARYYVRAGNSTRELDTREALDHIASRTRRS